MSTPIIGHFGSRTAIRGFIAVVALLLGLSLVASPAAATGRPQFYTDAFDFDSVNADLSADCGFAVTQTGHGDVRGWDRFNADGSYAGGSVQVTIAGTFSSDAASVEYTTETRNIDRIAADGSDTGSAHGLLLHVVVPGQGVVGQVAGQLVVSFPAGGGEPTFVLQVGHSTEDAFFGSPGHPGTLCSLLAG